MTFDIAALNWPAKDRLRSGTFWVCLNKQINLMIVSKLHDCFSARVCTPWALNNWLKAPCCCFGFKAPMLQFGFRPCRECVLKNRMDAYSAGKPISQLHPYCKPCQDEERKQGLEIWYLIKETKPEVLVPVAWKRRRWGSPHRNWHY